MLQEITSGKFADEWMAEHKAGKPQFKALRKEGDRAPDRGRRLEAPRMMPWMKEHRAVKERRTPSPAGTRGCRHLLSRARVQSAANVGVRALLDGSVSFIHGIMPRSFLPTFPRSGARSPSFSSAFELWLAGLVLGHPFVREFAAGDLLQHGLHDPSSSLRSPRARAAREIAILRRCLLTSSACWPMPPRR